MKFATASALFVAALASTVYAGECRCDDDDSRVTATGTLTVGPVPTGTEAWSSVWSSTWSDSWSSSWATSWTVTGSAAPSVPTDPNAVPSPPSVSVSTTTVSTTVTVTLPPTPTATQPSGGNILTIPRKALLAIGTGAVILSQLL
ncbi:hypothetical protein BX616_002583 [Lobosporangium transversale]|uniref:Uncharacterized protein n=1 Tax=Lobosporangium transversale TaxID=64571 RepID=A0A1Y2GW79_9FUNG|nr:hypothetical protein BCR41DRAFT_350686 [Lobosporangium transversale]KAF9900461.1 hypothetical protein BX616_002583 [Lobosporangium transversale]ORZ20943.1 hypothetical protein BCR41DRAFT_350686 [Lobosporangium transversale]|eukprot:XP_021882852.1 hypothetical protein BCR41DRAFT_350686 [Lobosporangium transversale]